MTLDARLVREDGIVARSIAGETILVPVTRRAQDMGLFTLNEVGTFIWERLDGSRSLREIAGEMTSSFEVASDQAEQDLLGFARMLAETGCAGEGAS